MERASRSGRGKHPTRTRTRLRGTEAQRAQQTTFSHSSTRCSGYLHCTGTSVQFTIRSVYHVNAIPDDDAMDQLPKGRDFSAPPPFTIGCYVQHRHYMNLGNEVHYIVQTLIVTLGAKVH
jgi:hypothetical protein